jgi:hypothetical protein
MRVDVSKYEPGVALSKKLIVSACPICGVGCVVRGSRPELHRYVHEFEVYRHVAKAERGGRGSMRSRPTRVCRLAKPKRVSKRKLLMAEVEARLVAQEGAAP